MTKDDWNECADGSLLLKVIGRKAGPPGSDARRPFVLAACDCAERALQFLRDGNKVPRKAIEAARAWANGLDGMTIEQVRAFAPPLKDESRTDTRTVLASPGGDRATADRSVALAASWAAGSVCIENFSFSEDAGRAAWFAGLAAKYDAGAQTTRLPPEYAQQLILRQCADDIRRRFPSPPEGLS